MPPLSLSNPKALEKSPSLSLMIGNLMPFSDMIRSVMMRTMRMTTFRDAEFMSIVLTVTWLSVQTPTTCVIEVTIAIVISVM